MPTLDEKINSFEEQISIRHLRIGEVLSERFLVGDPNDELSHSAFVILGIGLSYFEMIEQFVTGNDSDRRSGHFFEEGFKRVYVATCLSPDDISRIYRRHRSGLFHTAMSKDLCSIDRSKMKAFEIQGDVLYINPAVLIQDVRLHFDQYCRDLRDPDPSKDLLRQNFLKTFDRLSSAANPQGTIVPGTTPPPGLV